MSRKKQSVLSMEQQIDLFNWLQAQKSEIHKKKIARVLVQKQAADTLGFAISDGMFQRMGNKCGIVYPKARKKIRATIDEEAILILAELETIIQRVEKLLEKEMDSMCVDGETTHDCEIY